MPHWMNEMNLIKREKWLKWEKIQNMCKWTYLKWFQLNEMNMKTYNLYFIIQLILYSIV